MLFRVVTSHLVQMVLLEGFAHLAGSRLYAMWIAVVPDDHWRIIPVGRSRGIHGM